MMSDDGLRPGVWANKSIGQNIILPSRRMLVAPNTKKKQTEVSALPPSSSLHSTSSPLLTFRPLLRDR